ncbi:MAG: HAD family hydrolase [Firmicutes bacterium]|nr:HAD family hydrolase [Bacillota bacterium]
MIKTIIFDIYDTIIQVERHANADIVMEHLRRRGAKPDRDDFLKLWGDYYRRAELSDEFRTEAEIFYDRVAWLYGICGCGDDPRTAYNATVAKSVQRTAYPDAADALAALRKRFRVVAGSNADNAPLTAHLSKCGIEMDALYTSESFKVYKSKPRFYQAILDAEGIKPEEALFVGDSHTEDVEVPASMGIRSVWMRRGRQDKDYGQIFTADSLTEMAEFILERF